MGHIFKISCLRDDIASGHLFTALVLPLCPMDTKAGFHFKDQLKNLALVNQCLVIIFCSLFFKIQNSVMMCVNLPFQP